MRITADIALDDAEVAQLKTIAGTDDPTTLRKAASTAIDHVVRVCSTASDKPPLLMDIHVFMASRLLEDESAPIDHEAIATVLDAWRCAEGQLNPDARRALRLLQRLTMEVLHAKNKDDFETAFHEQYAPLLSQKAAAFARTYMEVMQWWAEGGSTPADGHYLENVVSKVYTEATATLGAKKKPDYIKKRLGAAKDVLDSYVFD